jgi:hypothetical protein
MIALMTLFASISFCQDGLPGALKSLFKDRVDAVSRKDTATLSKLCAKNYRCINSAGVQMNLAELKKAVIESETPVKLVTILSFQPFIAEDESMAFATFEIEEKVAENSRGIAKNSLILTEIYKKEHSRWKIQLTHASQKICLLPN